MKKRESKNSADRARVAEIARRLRPLAAGRGVGGWTFIETLVATILSQNTSDINSSRAYEQLRLSYPSWEEVASADPTELAAVIRSGGLASQKSRTIIATLQALHEHYGSFEPGHLDGTTDDDLLVELTAMRGIGLKTAACVLMFSLGRDICAVDTHVHRVANRLGIVAASNAERTFHDLRPLIPEGHARELHVSLIRFGRTICKSQRPHCFECPLFDLCGWEQKQTFAAAGIPGPRPVSGDLLLLDILGDAGE